ncbi:glycosyl hydrolase family 8 [Sporosarcina gallistercoris]|uniref:Glycosyl hydrolase n=1 Tax=Sporosarcina gallistercoris TaxID=2762245 RepID=A0ABR8PIY1_9BACL|nr:glycosyl hydrolase family 8 [Sporosarcina gallistercoris]MBD7908141.1 hypothetical protein [Sporosarcina gallistercoris]
MWTVYDSPERPATESFVRSHLLQQDGFIRTNITDRADEYLSESMGLWMLYVVVANEKKSFETQVTTLRNEFLTDDHLVTWQIIRGNHASANALIDDIRIIQALYMAAEKWDEPAYELLADQMSDSISRHQTSQGILTDFVETDSKKAGTELTLSYIVPQALDLMALRGELPQSIYQNTRKVLMEAPLSPEGFFPKQYSIRTDSYIYDADVNLIDQLYTGYHRAVWNGDVSALVSFTKRAFKEGDNKLYGRYDSKTGKPSVSYESASVYALAVMMSREANEHEFADQLLKHMEQLAVQNRESPYYGGYIDLDTKDTHSFDNLLALLAKQQSE